MLIYSDRGIVRDTEAGKRKLKVGSLVKIKSLEIVKEVKTRGYDFPGHFNSLMEYYCGLSGRIMDFEVIEGKKYYRLNIDKMDWQWSEDMFELGTLNNLMENE